MIRIIRRLSVLAAASTLACVALAGPAAADPPVIADPTAAAASYLVANYQHNSCEPAVDGDRYGTIYAGVCYPADGFTIDSIFALAAAKAGGDKLDQVVAYLDSVLPAYTGVNPATYGISTGGAAKALVAYQVLGTHTGTQADLLDLVTDNICTAVAVDCVAPGAARNIYSGISQSFVVLALGRADAAPAIGPAVDFLLGSTQCADGGFTSGLPPAACASDVDATAYGLSALQAAGPVVTGVDRIAAVDAAADDAIAYLLDAQAGDGSWDGNANSTGLAVSALSALDDPAAVAAVASGRAWLIAAQAGCSAAPAVIGSVLVGDGDAFKATSDALLGLAGESLVTLTAHGTAAAAPAPDCTVPLPAPAPSTSEPIAAPVAVAVDVAVVAVVAAAPQLAATGSANMMLAVIGGAALITGGGALVLARRRA